MMNDAEIDHSDVSDDSDCIRLEGGVAEKYI